MMSLVECPAVNNAAIDSNVPFGVYFSIGSMSHCSGRCRPCGYFHQKDGCACGVKCNYCHQCPPDELKNRKKAKQSIRKILMHHGNLSGCGILHCVSQVLFSSTKLEVIARALERNKKHLKFLNKMWRHGILKEVSEHGGKKFGRTISGDQSLIPDLNTNGSDSLFREIGENVLKTILSAMMQKVQDRFSSSDWCAVATENMRSLEEALAIFNGNTQQHPELFLSNGAMAPTSMVADNSSMPNLVSSEDSHVKVSGSGLTGLVNHLGDNITTPIEMDKQAAFRKESTMDSSTSTVAGPDTESPNNSLTSVATSVSRNGTSVSRNGTSVSRNGTSVSRNSSSSDLQNVLASFGISRSESGAGLLQKGNPPSQMSQSVRNTAASFPLLSAATSSLENSTLGNYSFCENSVPQASADNSLPGSLDFLLEPVKLGQKNVLSNSLPEGNFNFTSLSSSCEPQVSSASSSSATSELCRTLPFQTFIKPNDRSSTPISNNACHMPCASGAPSTGLNNQLNTDRDWLLQNIAASPLICPNRINSASHSAAGVGADWNCNNTTQGGDWNCNNTMQGGERNYSTMQGGDWNCNIMQGGDWNCNTSSMQGGEGNCNTKQGGEGNCNSVSCVPGSGSLQSVSILTNSAIGSIVNNSVGASNIVMIAVPLVVAQNADQNPGTFRVNPTFLGCSSLASTSDVSQAQQNTGGVQMPNNCQAINVGSLSDLMFGNNVSRNTGFGERVAIPS